MATGSAINLFGSVVHDATPPVAAAINLYASVVHDATPPTAAGINLFGSVVHNAAQISGTVADITGTVGNPATFDGTPMGVSTGSVNYQWSWQSVPSGSSIANATFPLPDNKVNTYFDMTDNKGLWHFEGGATDSSGDGRNGTVNNATLVAGKVGSQAYQFVDADDSYVNFGAASDFLSTSSPFSLSLWMKGDSGWSPAVYDSIVGFTNGFSWSQGVGIFWQNATTIRAFVDRWDGSTVDAPVDPSVWNHLVLTYDQTDIKIYVNGSFIATNGVGATLTGLGNDLQVGRLGTHGRLEAALDEFAIWERTLSDLEINNLYFLQSGSCASGSVGLGETFSFTPDVTGTYTIQLELDDSLSSMSGNVNAVISSGGGPGVTGTGSIEGVVWELTSETTGASVIEGNVWELSTEAAGESRNEGVVWELSAEPLDKPSLNIPDITSISGASSCFYATASYTETGSIAYAWEWVSIPGGSLITSGSRTGFSGSGGAYSEIPTGSTACYLPDVIGSYVVKGTFYSDTGSGGGSFAFDTATGVVSGPPEPVITSSNPNTKLVEADDASSGYVFNTYKMMSVQRTRTIEQIPFIFGTKSKQTLRLRTNQEFTGSS
jgi:hypothetical protein